MKRTILENVFYSKLKKAETFDLEGYLVPVLSKGNSGINIQNFRAKQLEGNVRNPNIQRFLKLWNDSQYLSKFSLIPEFPLLVMDKPLWSEITKEQGFKGKDTSFFCTDFLVPSLGINIDIDAYGTHDDNYDKCRDLYIRRAFDLGVIRTKKFSIPDERLWKEGIDDIEKQVRAREEWLKKNYMLPGDGKWKILQDDICYERFIREFPYRFISYLEDYDKEFRTALLTRNSGFYGGGFYKVKLETLKTKCPEFYDTLKTNPVVRNEVSVFAKKVFRNLVLEFLDG